MDKERRRRITESITETLRKRYGSASALFFLLTKADDHDCLHMMSDFNSLENNESG